MGNTSLTLTAAVTLAALFAGCSDEGMQSTPPPAVSGPQVQTLSVNVQHASGAALEPQYKQPVTQLDMRPDKAINLGLNKLAVSDFGTEAVEILNTTGKETGTISKGLIHPDGDWYDSQGNLYVADYGGVDVQEYAPNGTSPAFTYSAGLIDPVDVTADTQDDVFVADYDNGAQSGTVTEYAQESNDITYQCEPGGSVEGVAVDKSGDVFASYNAGGAAKIVEYKGGLSGCAGTVLKVTLSYAGGLVVDEKNDLVACDQTAGVVDIIKSPYTKVSSKIKGFSEPFHVGLNAGNKLLFVADVVKAEVFVDKYPSGSSYTTLGSANGLSDPAGVAVH